MAMARLMDIPVMLSPFVALRVNSAKHLGGHRNRPFAAAQGDKKGRRPDGDGLFLRFF